MFPQEYNDDMHKLIVDRLEERNRKLEIINRCESSSRKSFLAPAIGVLIAASFVGIIFFISPNVSDDATEPCRSGLENVQDLIDAKEYDKALQEVNKEISHVDSVLNMLEKQTDTGDEEALYEIQSYVLKKDDLLKERETLKRKLDD